MSDASWYLRLLLKQQIGHVLNESADPIYDALGVDPNWAKQPPPEAPADGGGDG